MSSRASASRSSNGCRLAPITACSALVAACIALTAAPATAGPVKSEFAILHTWKVGGDGGWDYLSFDRTTRRLFVSRTGRVDVISIDTGTVVGSIPNTRGVHGIALSNDMRRGFTSNGRANTVTGFDLDSLQVLKEAQIPGSNPDAILYDRSGQYVFTFNGASNDVTVLDANGLTVAGRIPLPDKPEFAVDDGSGRIFVNIESAPGQMVVIDSNALAVKATWPLPGCDSPTGLAIDRKHQRLFSVCDGKIMVVTDLNNGKHIASIPIGEHPDAAVFDQRRNLVFSSNGDGTLTVIHQDTPDHYTVTQNLATRRGARTMALDPDTGRLYLVTAEFGPAQPASGTQTAAPPAAMAGSFVVLAVGVR